jgi:biotin carboxyl carrier protein
LNQHNYIIENEKISWIKNPIEVLADLYHYLHMDYVAGKPAANMIWCHDNALLQEGLAFYATLKERLGVFSFVDIEKLLAATKHAEFSEQQWLDIQSAHAGFQAGTEVLSVLPYIAMQTGFFDLLVNDDLTITIPDALTDADLQARMAKVLVPPPVAKSDEILSVSGGMFYPREAPGMDPFVLEGTHFNEGEPLYIVEVMKMFNKVYAPFSGTIDKVLVDGDGVIIKKGQPLFKITPDEIVVVETPEAIKARRQQKTAALLQSIN